LSEFDPGIEEYLSGSTVHFVAEVVYHFFHPCLHNFDGTLEAWTRVTIQDGSVPNTLASRFEERILLGVQTQTLMRSRGWGRRRVVASRAATLVAVFYAAGCAIVSCRNDPVVSDQDGTYTSFHAVGTEGR